jgi:lipoprotein-releasing system permease protein
VQGIEVRLNDIVNAEEVKAQLISQIQNSESLQIETWYDLHKDLFSVMNIERWSAYIILLCIIAVATFNLLGSLTMTVIEKKRDIGVLISMGAKQNAIKKIFMLEGIFVGTVGTLCGIVLGLLVIILQDKYHLFSLDPRVYIIPAIPVEMHLLDSILVSVSSLFLALVASYYPAQRASRTIPVESIRWE